MSVIRCYSLFSVWLRTGSSPADINIGNIIVGGKGDPNANSGNVNSDADITTTDSVLGLGQDVTAEVEKVFLVDFFLSFKINASFFKPVSL